MVVSAWIVSWKQEHFDDKDVLIVQGVSLCGDIKSQPKGEPKWALNKQAHFFAYYLL